MAEVKIDIGALNALTDKAARGGLHAALGEAETIMKGDVLNRQGTGRKYGSHTASAPGEAPAKDTGNLSANTNADSSLREDGDTLSGSVVSNAEYAEALEKGSKHTAKSRTADALFGMQGRYGPARLTALASEVGTERTAARPFLSRLGTEFSGRLASAFVRGGEGMNSTAAIFARLNGSLSIIDRLDVFEDRAAIFNDRAPDDFQFSGKAALVIAAPSSDIDASTFSETIRDITQDVRLYARDTGSTADIDALARAVRDLFHNQPEALIVTGAVPIICQAAGPTVSPTTDPSLVGRRISLRLELERI